MVTATKFNLDDIRVKSLGQIISNYRELSEIITGRKDLCDLRTLCSDEGFYVDTSAKSISVLRGLNPAVAVTVASFPRPMLETAAYYAAGSSPDRATDAYTGMQIAMVNAAKPYDLLRYPTGNDNPFLPFPPRRPTVSGEITEQFMINGTIGNLSDRITGRLRGRGYQEFKYYSVPGGFAVATQLERIDDKGRPAKKSRWTTSKIAGWYGITDYFSRLLRGAKGRFRLPVFIITNLDFQDDRTLANQDDLKSWKVMGRPSLSRDRRDASVLPGTRVWIYVYEFMPQKSKDGGIVANDGDRLELSSHKLALGLK